MESAEVDLQPFCDQEENCRYPGLMKPWAVDGLKVACDARILVAFPTDEPTNITPEMRVPRVSQIVDPARRVVCETAWPETFEACPSCGQLGYSKAFECRRCRGKGHQECDLGHEHRCKECNGKGIAKHGTKKLHIPCENSLCLVKFGDFTFKREAVQKLSKLPRPLLWGIGNEVLVVKSGDIIGILSPVFVEQ